MNIFFLDRDPAQAARWLCDKHIRKMGLEAVQMLARAYRSERATWPPPLRLDGEPYRGGYANHPATLWTCASLDHWRWLAAHAAAIFDEHERRFGRKPAPARALAYMLERPPIWLPSGWRDPPQCMPDEFRQPSALRAYRAFYRRGKAHLHAWTDAEPPPWLTA